MNRFGAFAAGLLAAALFAGSASGDSSFTLGQTPPPNVSLTQHLLILQTGVSGGPSYTVPPGTWRVTSWSVNVGNEFNGTGLMAAVFATPSGTDSYKIDAVTPAESPTLNMLNTFPASLTVHGGDVLGVWNGAGLFENALYTGGEDDTVAFALSVDPAPSLGDSVSTIPDNSILVPVSVTLASLDPAQMITDLQTTVSGLGLPKGTATALNSSLAEASAALARKNGTAACNALNAFLNKVQAQTGKKLTPDEADALTGAANQIRAQLGC